MSILLTKTLFILVFALTSLGSLAYTPIDTAMAIRIGGINQWISIKGKDLQSPVLLFLHGGPGNSVMGYAEKFTAELQKHFVVVQWDQRESGKTASLNPPGNIRAVEVMEGDAIEVIHYLQKKFSQDKIYLMGHSWGGFLGLLVAAHHPELLHGYIAICPMIHQIESERIALQWMMNKAKAENNQKALAELSQVRIPFENGEQLYYHRGWLIHYRGGKFPDKDFVLTWSEKWLGLFNEASAYNFFEIAPEMGCPVYFFAGGKDLQTNHKLISDYYEAVTAKQKKFFLFENSAHNLTTSEPARLQSTIIREVLGK